MGPKTPPPRPNKPYSPKMMPGQVPSRSYPVDEPMPTDRPSQRPWEVGCTLHGESQEGAPFRTVKIQGDRFKPFYTPAVLYPCCGPCCYRGGSG